MVSLAMAQCVFGAGDDELGDAGGAGTAGWVLASMTGLPYENTYYGNRDDIGTPGYRGGSALPVSLIEVPSRTDERHWRNRCPLGHRI